jgi:hypothetical protein
MRVLIIDDEARAKADQVLIYALAHPFYLGSAPVPGDRAEYCCELNTFRCVFSLSVDRKGDRYRHLSISVPSDKYPNPWAVAEIAGLFGFSKPEEGVEARVKAGAWIANANKIEHCVVVAELLTGE